MSGERKGWHGARTLGYQGAGQSEIFCGQREIFERQLVRHLVAIGFCPLFSVSVRCSLFVCVCVCVCVCVLCVCVLAWGCCYDENCNVYVYVKLSQLLDYILL